MTWHQRQRKYINSGQPAASLKENRVAWHKSLRMKQWNRESRMGSTGEEEEAKRRQ